MNKIDSIMYMCEGLDRRQVRTKKAIITSFLELMKEKDISRITITELSQKAGIDRKTFYLHFKNIESVYAEIGNKIVDIVGMTVKSYMNSNIKQSPYYLFSAINDMLSEKIDFFRDAVKCNSFTVYIEKIKNAYYSELVKAYCDSENTISEQVKLTLEFISSGTVSMYLRWLRGEADISLDELAKFSEDMIINGVTGGSVSHFL